MKVQEPDKIVTVGSKMVTAMPTKLRIQSPNLNLVKEAFDIVISNDNGETWKLIGSGNDGKAIFLELFPGAANKLIYPEEKDPNPYKEQ